ncbi:MAG: hypothetical protein HY447_03630 [Candidatus Omnitrophica bacterium]|nr:hypothetical protein [Candidatus Omnitrophota bacterium]
MPKDETDPEDPMEMIGIELPAQSEDELRDMALCFAEEFAREGYDEERLFAMFRNPFYQGPYLAWKQKGDEFIRSVIQEAMRMWRPERKKS